MSQHLFLFAHQDDETPVFLEIESLIDAGERVVVCYLTSGRLDGGLAAARNTESTLVLQKLGVNPADIHFIGTDLSIPDGRLIEQIEHVYAHMAQWLEKQGPFSSIYSLAWEGGHQDHDAVYAIAVKLASQAGIVKSSYQFPYYHGKGLKGSFFKVLNAIPENGPVLKKTIPISKRIKYFHLCLSYPSQYKTWIGLGPFFLIHYVFDGTQVLQKLMPERVGQRPHAQSSLYERRKFYSYEKFKSTLDKFTP
jgi:LmbE family N-acetylglucosaminyl deacetylase